MGCVAAVRRVGNLNADGIPAGVAEEDAFVSNFDDLAYVTQNPHVCRGLSLENARWAFCSTKESNWHPLTWLSHMLDCSFFGLKPAGHHATNLAFHTANALLLFLLLRRATDTFWPSAFVAAVRAHPSGSSCSVGRWNAKTF